MSKKGTRTHQKWDWLYGVNPIMEALRSDRAVHEILVADGTRDRRLTEITELAARKNIAMRKSSRGELDRITTGATHQGVVARVAAAQYADADELLEQIALQVGTSIVPLVVLLDGIEDPRNFGAILRTAECAGVHAVFVTERRAVGLTETVAKASAGAVEHVRVGRVTNLTRLIDQLKERNVWVVGASADAGIAHTEWDWTRPSAIVLGSEGAGLHRLVREHCDALVSIPVVGKIESLNVSVAAGVIFYEAMRQRRSQDKKQD